MWITQKQPGNANEWVETNSVDVIKMIVQVNIMHFWTQFEWNVIQQTIVGQLKDTSYL